MKSRKKSLILVAVFLLVLVALLYIYLFTGARMKNIMFSISAMVDGAMRQQLWDL